MTAAIPRLTSQSIRHTRLRRRALIGGYNKNKPAVFKAIFFDGAGTLIHLPQSVGYHYALVGKRVGLTLDSAALDRAFAAGRPTVIDVIADMDALSARPWG